MPWYNRNRSVHSYIRLGLLVVLSAALAVSFGRVPAAYAAYLTVTNANDSGPGSLREAIAVASSGDTIRFVRDLREQTITLTSGSLVITKDLTILGPGASHVTISGNHMMRVLYVAHNITVRLDNLAIAHGMSGASLNGGGILNDGRLTVANSSFLNNSAIFGGAIYNSTFASLTVSNSSFLSNHVDSSYYMPRGAGIANYGQLTVANSTFSDNIATTSGNVSGTSGVIYNFSSLRVTNSTFAANVTMSIRNTEIAVVKNTLVADYGCDGSFSSDSTHNLTTSDDCGPGFTQTTDSDLQLGPLQDNGGATQTFGLLPGSVAIDAGDNATCTAAPVNNRDQRGMVRPQGHACDIGAFEAEHQNEPPIANNDNYVMNLETPFTVAAPGVLANDTDPENDALQALLSSRPSHGTLTLNTDGSFTYTPEKGFVGTDTFTYKAYDGGDVTSGATVTVTVAKIVQIVANTDSYAAAPGTTVKVPAPGVLGNDTQADGKPLTAQLVGEPTHGTLTFNTDGSFLYTSNAGFFGVDQFTYQATDGYENSNIATVTLTVQK